MAKIPFSEWTPDSPDLGAGAAEALNVFPRTDRSYGPLNGLVEYSGALDGACLGAFSAQKADDATIQNFAGDASKLYKLSATSYSDGSKTGGYTLAEGERWRFARFGSRVIAAGFGNPLQSWDMAASPTKFADLAAAAPQARHIQVVRDFVMVGNTWDATFGYVPNRVWWPEINNPTSWPTPGTQAAYNAQSDYQDLPNGGWVQAILGAIGGADAAIFCEGSVYRAQYEGSPNIFRFDEVERARGTPAPGSVVGNGAVAAYLAEDGFYAFNGASSTPIGARKVDKWFWGKVDQNALDLVASTVDPINKLLIWAFPDGNAGRLCNNLLLWNWELNRWSHGEINLEMIFSARTEGYALEGLDGVSASLDALPYSLDSRLWTGGRLALSAFSTSHKMGFFTGDTLAATITTGEFDGDGRRVFVTGVRPLIDGGSPTVSIGGRESLAESVIYGAATAQGVDGVCSQRVSARYARAQLQTQAGASWTHAQGVEPAFRLEGRR